MLVETLSQKRGIISFYDGKKYIIFSTFYGVVAESTSITRTDDDEGHEKSVKIVFDICNWYGYWALEPIITRGIRKSEKTFVNKAVNIEYNRVENTENHLDKRLVLSTEEY